MHLDYYSFFRHIEKGTDGVFDNVFDKTILEMARKQQQATSLQTLADQIALLSNKHGKDYVRGVLILFIFFCC